MATLKVTAEPNTQNIQSVVSINAPLEKVFKYYTEKDLVAKWWGQGQEVEVDYFVPGAGGKWRFVQRMGDFEAAFHGCFHAVEENKMAIQTFEFEGMPETGHVALERADFVAINDNQTEVRITSTYQSVEDRDGMVASGMEAGFRKSVEALGALIEEK